MKSIRPILAASFIAVVALTAWQASSAEPADIIAARRANQKRVGELSKSIKTAVAANATAASLLDQVKEMDDRAKLIKGYFPPGTETGDTKARPEIWSNRAGFDAAADRYIGEFNKLLVIAQAGDTAAFGPQYETAAATCGACHRDFRAR